MDTENAKWTPDEASHDPRKGTCSEEQLPLILMLIVEEEFASVLQRMRRENNPLSSTRRCAWDTGDLLAIQVSTKGLLFAPEIVPSSLQQRARDEASASKPGGQRGRS